MYTHVCVCPCVCVCLRVCVCMQCNIRWWHVMWRSVMRVFMFNHIYICRHIYICVMYDWLWITSLYMYIPRYPLSVFVQPVLVMFMTRWRCPCIPRIKHQDKQISPTNSLSSQSKTNTYGEVQECRMLIIYPIHDYFMNLKNVPSDFTWINSKRRRRLICSRKFNLALRYPLDCIFCRVAFVLEKPAMWLGANMFLWFNFAAQKSW